MLVDDYKSLFLKGVPLMDTRAPTEFGRGSFPGAVNLPLMNDEERARVGTCYKQQGPEAALALGHSLVSGSVKEQRLQSWATFAHQHPEGVLFCFRGGLRSQIVQQWLKTEAGISYPRVAGGYKALRHFLLEVLEQEGVGHRLWVVGGMTGTGKTQLVNSVDCGVDLEGFAHHRGSSFGQRVGGQPSQIDFEHRLAIRLLELVESPLRVVEDEGMFVGSCSVPHGFYQAMSQASLIWLEDSFANRVDRILQDYVVGQYQEHVGFYGEAAFETYSLHLTSALNRIEKRLGGVRHQHARKLLQVALDEQGSSGSFEAHRLWIEYLLREYYDPMYLHQRSQKVHRGIFSGNLEEVRAYVQSQRV
jgi:tRNA 2-selenouridine synthase